MQGNCGKIRDLAEFKMSVKSKKEDGMRKLLLFLLILFVFHAEDSSAALVNYNNDVIYDDLSGIYWVADLSLFAGWQMNYEQQLQEISALNIAGANWSMANESQINSLYTQYDSEEIMQAFSPTLEHPGDSIYWSGRYDKTFSNSSGIEMVYSARIVDILGTDELDGPFWISGYGNAAFGSIATGAWVATTTIPESSTPEPNTMILLSFGILGIAGISRNCKK